PFVRKANCLAIKIDAENRALRDDYLAHKETDIARATADVQHMHAVTEPGRTHHSFRNRSKQLRLHYQPVVLGLRSAKRVVSIIHQSPLTLMASGALSSFESSLHQFVPNFDLLSLPQQ